MQIWVIITVSLANTSARYGGGVYVCVGEYVKFGDESSFAHNSAGRLGSGSIVW